MKDIALEEAKKLRQTFYYLAACNKLLTAENRGLCSTIALQKPLKKKQTKLNLQQQKVYYSRAVL